MWWNTNFHESVHFSSHSVWHWLWHRCLQVHINLCQLQALLTNLLQFHIYSIAGQDLWAHVQVSGRPPVPETKGLNAFPDSANLFLYTSFILLMLFCWPFTHPQVHEKSWMEMQTVLILPEYRRHLCHEIKSLLCSSSPLDLHTWLNLLCDWSCVHPVLHLSDVSSECSLQVRVQTLWIINSVRSPDAME